MKTTINGINFDLTTRVTKAPMDKNGNKRYDIALLIDGKELKDTIPGARKVKAGYRVQAYNEDMAVDTVLELFKSSLQTKEPAKNANGTVSSTHRTVTDQIQGYILDNLSDDNSEHVMDKLEDVVEGFMNWYGEYERRRTPNVQAAFKEWLQGLPSELYITPYYYDMRELMDKWLGTTDKNYTDDVVSHRFHALIFREFNKLIASEGIDSIYNRL